jgi:hypothetical protein
LLASPALTNRQIIFFERIEGNRLNLRQVAINSAAMLTIFSLFEANYSGKLIPELALYRSIQLESHLQLGMDLQRP